MERRELLKYTKILAIAALGFSILGRRSDRAAAENEIGFLEQKIPLLMERSGIPGLALAVVDGDRILWSRGFGITSTKKARSVSDRTVFAAASLAKPLFAYGVLKMQERGQIDLDTPLTKYTAKPYIKDPRIATITARMVLSHTTGFPNWSGSAPVWIESRPGTKFGYSGEGYLYLQKVIETITQTKLQDWIDRNILLPLKMKNSSYVWQNKYVSMAADGHDRAGKAFAISKPKKAISAGSLRSTAVDYARFLLAMMKPGQDMYDSRLTQASIQAMLRPQVKITRDLSWGLGWGLESTSEGDFFWHWGDGNIQKSFTLGSIERKKAIVILTNSQNGLKICPDIVGTSIPGEHPAFSFEMIRY